MDVLPTLSLLGTSISTFMVLMAVCYVIGFAWSVRLGIRLGIPRQDVMDGCVVGAITALFGAKLGHVLFESSGHKLANGSTAAGVWDLLKADPWHWARVEDPGYVWYGGALLLVPVALWFTASRGIDRGDAADAGAPAFALSVGLGRLACFLGGCCYGLPADIPWAVQFPVGDAALLGRVHPTQLYESVTGLGLLAYVLWRFPRRKVKGELLAVSVVVYALQRFVIEFYRGDPERGVYGSLSTSQLISVPVFVVAMLVTLWLFRNGSPVPQAENRTKPA
jgi:phosphatidylglycerol:prolipoprotein diacylglycerol transferase